MAVLSMVLGISSLTSSLLVLKPRFLRFIPYHVRWGSKVATAVVGFLFLVNAPGLLRGRRASWTITMGLTGAATILHVIRGFNLEGAALSALYALVLFSSRRRFMAPGNPSMFKRAVFLLLAVLVFNFAYAFLAIRLTPKEGYIPDLGMLIRYSISLITFNTPPEIVYGVREGRFLVSTVYAVNAACLLVAVFLLLQPIVMASEHNPADLNIATRIAEEWGHSSLVFFTLWPDKTIFFNSDRTCYLAYKQVGDVAVVLGDPVGPPEARVLMIGDFTRYAAERGIDAVFYQVLPEHLEDYRKAGLTIVKCGEEAIVDIRFFNLSGQRWKSLRYTWNKMKKMGFRVEFYEPPLEDWLMEELEEVSRDWLSARKVGEKGFSLGWFEPEIVRHLEVSVAFDRHGKVSGFLTFVPMYNLDQVSPDLMRYRPLSPTGIIDLLLVESARHYSEKGFSKMNLGLAPLAHITPEEKAAWTDKAIKVIAESMPNLRGLYLFKEKYNPVWEPRYMAYPGALTLPRIALAVVRAGNPTGLARYVRRLRYNHGCNWMVI